MLRSFRSLHSNMTTAKAFTSRKRPSGNTNKRNTKRSDNNQPFIPSAAVKKISQIQLSDEQQVLKSNIFKFINDNLENYTGNPSVYLIDGDAGTGKSVILNSLFNEIQKISRTSDEGKQILTNTKKPCC